MRKILVTGANGQLGWELMQCAEQYSSTFTFLFVGGEILNTAHTP